MHLFTHSVVLGHSNNLLSSLLKQRLIFNLLFAFIIILLSACGSDKSEPQSANTAISGYVIDGPVSDSSVTLHRVNADGTPGEQVAGPFTTDANGQWSGTVPESITGTLVVVATGGQYTDDATSETITLAADETLHSWFDPASPDDYGVVSPITDSLWQVAQQQMSNGTTLVEAVATAQQLATDFWGLDPTSTVPDASSNTAANLRYGAILGGYSFLMANRTELQQEPFVSMNRFTLTRLIMDDMADGRLDGIGIDGSRLEAPDGTLFPVLSANDLSAFFTYVNNYTAFLQLPPIVIPNNYRVYPELYPCPTDGFFIYGQATEEQNLTGYGNVFPSSIGYGRNKVQVTVRNVQVTRSNVNHPQTGEPGYTDSYEITFGDPGLMLNNNPGTYLTGHVLRFQSGSFDSAGTVIGDMELDVDQRGVFHTSRNSPDVAHITSGGRLRFERGAQITVPDVNFFSSNARFAKICGSFDVGSGGDPTFEPAGDNHQDLFFVAANVLGLTGTVVLQNNSGDTNSITGNGTNFFQTPLPDGSFYNVSILTQPEGQTCSISNSAGQINGENIRTVGVTCANNPEPTYSIGGTVSGLNGGSLVLQNNAGDNLTVPTDGSFTFTTELFSGGAYAITVLSSPAAQTCSVSNATGITSSADITNVAVSCVTVASSYSIGGSVIGLNGTLILQNNGGDNLTLSTNSTFAFSTELLSGVGYSVSILNEPVTQTCTLSNQTGTTNNANITNIVVSCADLPKYSIGGTISGLNGTLVLQNNGGDNLTRTTNGPFSFNTELLSGAGYAVTLISSPNIQSCSFSNGSDSGTVSSANVTSVQVVCESSSALSNLSTSQGSLIPSFTTNQTSYQVSVSNGITSLTITPTAIDSNASILVDGNTVVSGNTSGAIALSVGANVISIPVTADGNTSTTNYTVTVTRDAPLSTDDSLSALSLSGSSVSPTFNSATLAYTASVGFSTTSISITPTATDSGATITVAGNDTASGNASSPINLLEGENPINISVLAEDGVTTRTYVVTVTRQAASGFAQEAYIKASNTGNNDQFGSVIAMDNNTLAVWARGEASNGPQNNNSLPSAGAVYVFVRDVNGIWSQQGYLKASNVGRGDKFGASLAISGDTIAIGAPDEDSQAVGINPSYRGDNNGQIDGGPTAYDAGAVYIFNRNASGFWQERDYIKGSTTANNHNFGISVSLEGDRLAVGAEGDLGNNASGELSGGAAYVFTRDGNGNWSQQALIKASNTGGGFGHVVSLSGNTLAVSAQREKSNATGINQDETDVSASNAGAVYVFTYDGNSTWTQQAYIKASNTESQDLFGFSMALSGDTLAVGAMFEDSNAILIDGDQADNSAEKAGAAYVFARVAGVWTQQAYIKASNTGAGDQFGRNIALSGDTLLVGAPQESSNAVGMDGDEANDLMFTAGAAYRYGRDVNGNWTKTLYLKASNTGQTDRFGSSVALTDSLMAVGAFGEDSRATGVNDPDQGNNTTFGGSSGAAYVISAQ